MIVVAISQRLVENEAYPETRDCLDVRWARLCSQLGILPLLLPTHFEPSPYFEVFAPQGLILTGGNDLASVSKSPLSAIRDAYEKRVLAIAMDRRLPIVGVCRGMQLVGEFFGAGVRAVAGHSRGVRHELSIDASTRAGRDLREIRGVASHHDYAVERVPEGFREVARSHDGVVEAMEHTDLPIVCQMWHPERDDALSEAQARVLHRLFDPQGART